MQENGFNGVNGRFRLNFDGTNERLLEVFQIAPGLKIQSAAAPLDDFPEADTPFAEKVPEESQDWNI